MSFKNIIMLFITSFCSLLIPFSSAFADSAGWQLIISEYVHYNNTLNRYITGVDDAHIKGNVLICLRSSGSSGGAISFYVKEYDPGSNTDEYLSNKKLFKLNPTSNISSKYCLQLDVSKYVDGDNGAAEIYVQTLDDYALFNIYD